MVEEILKDNTKEFDKKLLKYSVQITALNHLKENNQIKEKMYEKVKCAITDNYTMELNKDIK